VATDATRVYRIAPPAATDTTFVTDSGAWLDWYVSGDQLPSGMMTIGLPIPRVFSTWMSPTLSPPLLDANGFLLPGAHLTQLITESVLPPTATLQLAVFDVDDQAGEPCNEVDKVALNGFAVVGNISQHPSNTLTHSS
jgi:hypothetical protein